MACNQSTLYYFQINMLLCNIGKTYNETRFDLKKRFALPQKNLKLTFQAQKPLQQNLIEPATNPNEPFQNPYVVDQRT